MGLDQNLQDELTVHLTRLAGRIDALLPIHNATEDGDAWRIAADLARAASTTDLMLRAMAELFSGGGRPSDGTLREKFIASRILYAVEHGQPGDRIAYVAHNNHLQKTPVMFDGELVAYPVGLFLARALGDRYVAVALTHLGSRVPEMAVPAPTSVGFAIETVAIEPPRANSIESAASTAASASAMQIVRPHAATAPSESLGSIRSQSAVSDITPASFDAAIVVDRASIDEAAGDIHRPLRTEHRALLDDVEIATEVFGDPDDVPVVLVMGATASMLWWPDQLCNSIAAAGCRVVRYDHRDTGQSTTVEPGTSDYSAEDLTADLLGVMDSLSVDSAHLIGMSLGGYISQIAAVEHPERVRSLTLIGSEPLGAAEELPGIDNKFMTHFASMGNLDWSDDDAVENFLVEIGRLSAGSPERFDEAGTRDRVHAETARAVNIASAFNHAMVAADRDWTDAASRITKPTLVIHGAHDPILPLANGTAIAQHVNDAKLHVLSDAGHELNPLDLDEIAETVLSFMNSVNDQAARPS
jgi:pimeloyl-ACP methyl ester carboxylesterase